LFKHHHFFLHLA